MPKQIFQRNAPIKHNKFGKQFGAPGKIPGKKPAKKRQKPTLAIKPIFSDAKTDK